MQELSDWKKRKYKIAGLYRKFVSLADRVEKALNERIANEDRPNAKDELETLQADKADLEEKFEEMEQFFDACFKQLRMEDQSRDLHSRDTDKPVDVDWPKFAGKDGEDFAKFKEKLEKASLEI